MGRKNKRKKSAYSRKMKANPKKLIVKPVTQECSDMISVEPSNKFPLRGDVWFAEFGTHPGTSVQEGCRPAFVISNDTGNTHAETITVAPMTSKLKKMYLPTHVQMTSSDCPKLEPSMVLAEQITTIGKSALRNYVGRASENKVHEVEKAVEIHLGLV